MFETIVSKVSCVQVISNVFAHAILDAAGHSALIKQHFRFKCHQLKQSFVVRITIMHVSFTDAEL